MIGRTEIHFSDPCTYIHMYLPITWRFEVKKAAQGLGNLLECLLFVKLSDRLKLNYGRDLKIFCLYIKDSVYDIAKMTTYSIFTQHIKKINKG